MKTHVITFLQLLPFAEKMEKAVQTMADLGVTRINIKSFLVGDYTVKILYIAGRKQENPQPGKATGSQN